MNDILYGLSGGVTMIRAVFEPQKNVGLSTGSHLDESTLKSIPLWEMETGPSIIRSYVGSAVYRFFRWNTPDPVRGLVEEQSG